MRIGIVGSIWMRTPPEKYGGTEQVIANLCNGLTANGHDVTLFAPANSQVNAHVIPTVPLPLKEQGLPWNEISYNLYHMSTAFDYQKEFDILHVHLNKSQDYSALPLATYATTPILFTPHFKMPTEGYKPERYLLLQKYRDFPFTSISNSQRSPFYANFIKTVYNSINIDDYPFVSSPKDYYVWLGKMIPTKGTKEAILAAKKAGVKLYVLGAIESGTPEGKDYFDHEVKPLIDNKQIVFFENVGLPEKATLLGNAKAFLNPIQWDEPFGLVMIESLATGTPVIAYERGAAPELIADKKTGYLVKNEAQMIAAIKKVEKLDRAACHTYAATHFTTQQMVDGYEKAYRLTIDEWSSVQKKMREDNQHFLAKTIYQKL